MVHSALYTDTFTYIFFRMYFCPSNIFVLFFNRFLEHYLDDAELEVDEESLDETESNGGDAEGQNDTEEEFR